ncbi:centrosomal protein of 63 kDa isoform X2 [Cololabis saira]|uniref:centrosomal protein of 63 kDa isoform X2 n=1 Tax=Cololabis saira TaxID=129043 RepID=UPI002AD263AB|nr:centrosomal protein of 63 kDa isoform X2 [Cololabis saira]
MENYSESTQNLSSILSSCGPELQELMRQIDIMINNQRREWEAGMRDLELRLENREQELSTSKSITEQRDVEIGRLHKQLKDVQAGRQELVSKYEGQLLKVREEERHRLSVEWEQQRSQYQTQLATLEVHNKNLTDELFNMKSQRASLQEEREHGQSHLELQHLRTQLEKAQDTLHSQELELMSLRPLEALVGQYRRDQQLLSEERDELHATLVSQDTSMQRTSLEHERLRKEAARLDQALRAKDQVIRSLEDCLSTQECAGVETLRKDLERTSAKLQCARACEVQLKAELACVKERLENETRQRDEHSKTEQELRNLKAEHNASVAEMKKLREELLQARQKLPGELHQRDLSSSSSSGKLHLPAQVERAEQRTTELNMTQAQLETLQMENQHLKSLLQSLQSPSPKRGNSSRSSLRESYVPSPGRPGPGNHRVVQARADVEPHLDEQTHQEKNEGALLSHAVTGRLSPEQDRLQVDTRAVKAQSQGNAGCHVEEIQMIFKELQTPSHPATDRPCSQNSHRSSPFSSPSSSLSSSGGVKLTRGTSMPALSLSDFAAVGKSSGSEETVTSGSKEKVSPPSSEVSLSGSPESSMITHFLEEDTLRSMELVRRLDSYIQGLNESNGRTVSKNLASSSGPESNPNLQ